MNQDDLTSVEREALERLRANAPDAPEALASLSHTSRGRVIKALMDAGTETETDKTGTAAIDRPSDAPRPTSPPTLVDRVWAPTVDVGDKKVPIIPSSLGVLLVIVALVLVVRACVGDAYSWCDELDDAVDRARTVGGGLEIINMVVDDQLDPADDVEADALREAISDASAAAWSVWENSEEGSEAIRIERAYDAWEESLRDAC